jgi:autotransporter-associated beta strand protein
LNGSNTGTNTLAQVINDNGGATSLTKSGTGQWLVTAANTFSGVTTIQQGTLTVSSINSVSGGTASSSLGVPTTIANGTIGFSLTFRTGILNYVGTGETSDRVLDLSGTTGGATLQQSGSGLLKFTSDLTASGAGAKTLTLDGSTAGTGQLAGVIPDSSGGATALAKSGTGKWTLSGASTYSGNTTINAGTLALNGSGMIGTSSNLIINAGGTFDVSGLGGGYTLTASQVLLATNGAAATINGSLNIASASAVLTNVINTPTVNVTGGSLTLGGGMAFTVDVNNGGTPLSAGNYKLISKGSGGSVVGTAPSSVSVSGDGLAGGATAALNISGGELYLVVSGGSLVAPVIGSFGITSGHAILSFTGTSGQTWEILTSTNVAKPLATWDIVTTGTFSGSTVYYTNTTPNDPQRFYSVTSP